MSDPIKYSSVSVYDDSIVLSNEQERLIYAELGIHYDDAILG